MTAHRIIVTIPATSGIPKDAITNTWYASDVVAHSVALVTAFTADLHDFYESWNTYRSALHDWSNTSFKAYDMSDPVGSGVTRPAFAAGPLGLSATAAVSTLPSECALVMTFQSAVTFGLMRRRSRGRVYLGTFAAVAADSTNGRPNASLITTIATAGSALIAASAGAAEYDWVVYSGTGGAEVPGHHVDNGDTYVVDNGWVDNAWDTQRRRGLAMTAKTVFS